MCVYFFVDYIIFVFKEKDYEIIRFISFWFIVFNKICMEIWVIFIIIGKFVVLFVMCI